MVIRFNKEHDQLVLEQAGLKVKPCRVVEGKKGFGAVLSKAAAALSRIPAFLTGRLLKDTITNKYYYITKKRLSEFKNLQQVYSLRNQPTLLKLIREKAAFPERGLLLLKREVDNLKSGASNDVDQIAKLFGKCITGGWTKNKDAYVAILNKLAETNTALFTKCLNILKESSSEKENRVQEYAKDKNCFVKALEKEKGKKDTIEAGSSMALKNMTKCDELLYLAQELDVHKDNFNSIKKDFVELLNDDTNDDWAKDSQKYEPILRALQGKNDEIYDKCQQKVLIFKDIQVDSNISNQSQTNPLENVSGTSEKVQVEEKEPILTTQVDVVQHLLKDEAISKQKNLCFSPTSIFVLYAMIVNFLKTDSNSEDIELVKLAENAKALIDKLSFEKTIDNSKVDTDEREILGLRKKDENYITLNQAGFVLGDQETGKDKFFKESMLADLSFHEDSKKLQKAVILWMKNALKQDNISSPVNDSTLKYFCSVLTVSLSWSQPFANTQLSTFTFGESEQTQVQMMLGGTCFSKEIHINGISARVVKIPYLDPGDQLFRLIIMPNDIKDWPAIKQYCEGQNFKQSDYTFEENCKIAVCHPKTKIESEISLNALFGNQVDLNWQFSHKIIIEDDMSGTKAVAVSSGCQSKGIGSVTIDKSHYFFIVKEDNIVVQGCIDSKEAFPSSDNK